ncbi:MAG: restriction endonuclease subunit S [Spirochaetaceae bacterium]|nr:restriction endonuclease subunit S [Spirochaetaceae bacterium]
MTDGLKDAHREAIIATIAANERVERAVLFGSRVTGTNTVSSDVDIALFGDRLTLTDQARLAAALDEIPMAQSVDLLLYESINSSTLLDHIQAHGVELYASQEPGRGHGTQSAWTEHSCSAGRGWVELPLGNVIELKRGYDLPGRERLPGPVPVVSSSGVTGYHRESKAPGPGVVTGRYGTLGEVYFIQGDFWPLNTTLYVRNFNGNDPRFISYLLRGLDFSGHSDKAAVPGLNRNHLHEEPVGIPTDVREQRSIAHVLGTLDDKIELNRRMNATLEATTQALFRSWFVDFYPVRAKREGRDTGLPKDIADLFPDRLVDLEGGAAPEGWSIDNLADHFEAAKGVSYKGSGLGGDGVPLHNLNSIHEGGGYKFGGVKFYSGEYAERHSVRPGDVIVANTEQGHDRLLIGYAAIVPRLFGADGVASHHIYRLRPRAASWLSARFLFFLLNSARMHDLVSGYANGTTVNMLPIDGVQRPSFVVPPRALVEAFDVVTSRAEPRREHAVRESRTLIAIREGLLPRLVSGQLRVTGVSPTSVRDDRLAAVGAHEA